MLPWQPRSNHVHFAVADPSVEEGEGRGLQGFPERPRRGYLRSLHLKETHMSIAAVVHIFRDSSILTEQQAC